MSLKVLASIEVSTKQADDMCHVRMMEITGTETSRRLSEHISGVVDATNPIVDNPTMPIECESRRRSWINDAVALGDQRP